MEPFRIIQRYGFDGNDTPVPDLTVIVPTSNTAPYLDDCLNSLLVQGNLSLEIIVVDYRSTDGTLDKVHAFAQQYTHIPLTIVEQLQSGLGDARNFGFVLARGEFIACLDSDDFFAPGVYAEMINFARLQQCDIVFCRGVVFNHETQETNFFYDDWVWDQIAGSERQIVTTIEREPRLLQLEPNASIRILRRSFMEKYELRYPEGKRCEDQVPHYLALFQAKRVGAISSRGFFYRIERPGKLTASVTKWIDDALEAMAMAVGSAQNFQPSARAGAAMVYLSQRSVFGYGKKLPFHLRRKYYQSAGALFAQLPGEWVDIALRDILQKDIEGYAALSALRRRDIDFLMFWSGHPRRAPAIIFYLMNRPQLWSFGLDILRLRYGSVRRGLYKLWRQRYA